MKIYIYFNIEFYSKTFFFFQECIKPPSLHSPTPSNLTDRPPSSTRAPSQVSYNDLCFPKTSNYGSMRKRADVILQQNWICLRTLSTNFTNWFSQKNFPHYGSTSQPLTWGISWERDISVKAFKSKAVSGAWSQKVI